MAFGPIGPPPPKRWDAAASVYPSLKSELLMALVRFIGRAGCAFVMLMVSLAVAADGPSDSPQLVAPAGPISAVEQQKMFHLPPGFEIQLVAAEPEIRKPMNLNFDVHGRLYATQSTIYPFPVEGDEP